jgi:hypothetical protein
MWGITITNKHFSREGKLIGVTVITDDGNTNYMTIESYNDFLKNKEKYGKENKSKSLGED